VVKQKSGFTLIELIIAIVIISIAVLAIPRMSEITQKGVENSILQEAIFIATTELTQATTASWDENSTEPTDPNSYTRVIDTDLSCENNSTSPRYRLRPGHVNQPYHRKCLDSNITGPNYSATNPNVDALEDLNRSNSVVSLATSNQSGYKDNYRVDIVVTPNADFNGADDDIKMVTTTIKNSSGDTVTSLKTYSCNIGEADIYTRTLP
jgi:prepilin-type N-terminal cleavage/methylation domain-containing protein